MESAVFTAGLISFFSRCQRRLHWLNEPQDINKKIVSQPRCRWGRFSRPLTDFCSNFLNNSLDGTSNLIYNSIPINKQYKDWPAIARQPPPLLHVLISLKCLVFASASSQDWIWNKSGNNHSLKRPWQRRMLRISRKYHVLNIKFRLQDASTCRNSNDLYSYKSIAIESVQPDPWEKYERGKNCMQKVPGSGSWKLCPEKKKRGREREKRGGWAGEETCILRSESVDSALLLIFWFRANLAAFPCPSTSRLELFIWSSQFFKGTSQSLQYFTSLRSILFPFSGEILCLIL